MKRKLISVFIGLCLFGAGYFSSTHVSAIPPLPPILGKLLKTGQTTQYNGELDDGYYRKGLTKSYTVLDAGQFTGTKNIDLIHYTAATIAFAATTPGTITDAANGLAQFLTGDIIIISGAVTNNGVYTVSTGGVPGTIRTTEATTLQAAGASTSIAKREAHSNNCVLDNNTGLMWSRYAADKMGTASNGKMPWTGQLYDIFQYIAAANAAVLGGYSDWRIPNDLELLSLRDMEQPTAAPDATAFPGWPISDWTWSSTTLPSSAAYALLVHFLNGSLGGDVKTDSFFVALVRGD